jgi:hypothetical protein
MPQGLTINPINHINPINPKYMCSKSILKLLLLFQWVHTVLHFLVQPVKLSKFYTNTYL